MTIYQPWATLIAHGAKHFETRSWSTPYRGPLAIHASQRRLPPYAYGELLPLLRRLGLDPAYLPLGAVIATCTLADVYPADVVVLDGSERLLGDFTPGRYAWHLVDVLRCAPLVVRGRRLLWECALDGA